MVDLSIIIVSWNVWDLLRACLTSIQRLSRPTGKDVHSEAGQARLFGSVNQPHTLEVIVVDSASDDATTDLIPTLFPWVRLVASTENLGFTRGNNRGYDQSRGEYIFFLNPDTEIIDNGQTKGDSLWLLFQAIEEDPTVGMVGPQLRYGDGSWQNSRRRFPTHFTGFFESTWLGRLWPNNPWTSAMHMRTWPADFPHDVDWLVGAAMLARRSALEAIRTPEDSGPFDEGFFMYSEELDLSRRLKQAGWRILYFPTALVVHYEGRSSEQVVTARHIRFNRSKVRYYHKYFGARWASALRHYLLTEFRLQFLLEQIKLLLNHKPALRAARIQAYREVIESGLSGQ